MIDEIGELRKIKSERDLTYQDLAFKIGVHSQSIRNWIKGHNKPSRMAKRLIRNFIVYYRA